MKKFLKIIAIIVATGIVGAIITVGITLIAPTWAMSTAGLLTIQAISSVMIFGLIPILVIKYVNRKNPISSMLMHKGITLKQTLLVTLFALCALPAITFFGDLNSRMQLPEAFADLETTLRQMENAAMEIMYQFLNTSSYTQLFLNIFVIALLPAVFEEMFFRGWIQRSISKSCNIHIAVWSTAILFSAIHFQFYGFIPRMLIGAALGYIFAYTGSLWSAILAHFINNAVAVIMTFIAYNKISTIDFESIGTLDTWYIAVASFAISITLIVRLKLDKRKRVR